MNEQALKNEIAATEALLLEIRGAMSALQATESEFREKAAEFLGCSQWDLDQVIAKDLDAEQRQQHEKAAMELIREKAPSFLAMMNTLDINPDSALGSAAPPARDNTAGMPRPRRRMV
jgi:hypothetical protein